MDLRHFVLVRDHGQQTTLCDAADIQPATNQALRQERAPAGARVRHHRRNYRGSLTGITTPSSTAKMLLTHQDSITKVARAPDPDTRPRAGRATSGARSDGRRQASLPHLSKRDTEKRARDIAEWAATHVRPERWYHPREELVFEGSSCVGPGSRWQAGTTNFCRGTPRSVLPCMTGCQDPRG